MFRRVHELGQKRLVNFFGRRAAKLLTVNHREQRVWWIQLQRLANLRSRHMQQQQGFSDTARANEGDALPVAQKTEDLVYFDLPAVKLLGPADCTAMKEGVVDAHDPILRCSSGIVKQSAQAQ